MASQGKIVQCIGAVVDVEFPRDADAQGLRRAEDGRLRADPRSAAAARRRRRAHHRAGLVRRPAPRHDGQQHRRRRSRCRSARPRSAASWTCSATRSTSAARSTRTLTASIHRKAPAYDELSPVAGAARNRHQGDRPDLPVRQGRQGGPVRRRRRRQDRQHDGADQQHRQGALGPVGVRRRRRAHPRGQRLLSRDGRSRASSTSRTWASRRWRWSTAR